MIIYIVGHVADPSWDRGGYGKAVRESGVGVTLESFHYLGGQVGLFDLHEKRATMTETKAVRIGQQGEPSPNRPKAVKRAKLRKSID